MNMVDRPDDILDDMRLILFENTLEFFEISWRDELSLKAYEEGNLRSVASFEPFGFVEE